MADHFHDRPVCGNQPNVPTSPMCPGDQLIACGTIIDPGHPQFGRCLCRHHDPAAAVGGVGAVGGGAVAAGPGGAVAAGPLGEGGLPGCIGTECFEVTLAASDLRPETYQIDGDLNPLGEQRVYPFPQPSDGTYNLFHVRRALKFEADGADRMRQYDRSVPGRCTGSCTCIPSSDPKDRTTVISRVPVESVYTFPDGSGTATVKGSFKLETTRIKGLCTIGKATTERMSLEMPEEIKKRLASVPPKQG